MYSQCCGKLPNEGYNSAKGSKVPLQIAPLHCPDSIWKRKLKLLLFEQREPHKYAIAAKANTVGNL